MEHIHLPEDRSHLLLIVAGIALLMLALFALTSSLHLAGEVQRERQASQMGLRLSVQQALSDRFGHGVADGL